MNKLRLVNKKGEIVGYQESRYSENCDSLTPHHSLNCEYWCDTIGELEHVNFIAHDAEDRFTEIKIKGVDVYENDEIIITFKGTTQSCRVVYDRGYYHLVNSQHEKGEWGYLGEWLKDHLEVVGRAKDINP